MSNCMKALVRKKTLDPVAITETRLARVLSTYDLTALGVGSTLGVGVYVLAGHVAKEVAGPAVILSFLIAAVASVFAGLCYAEFGSRVPRAGSAYIYSYVCVGEFIAFVIGWNLILEYVIGSASVAKGLSLYLDTLINNTLQNTFQEIVPINVSFMATYFDFFSFGISVILAAALAFGMKESSIVNNIFTVLNIMVVLFVIIAGSFKANPENWNLPAPANSTEGTGGFFPFGASGVIKGAATCFYGFVGFDCIATTGEEVKNPQKAIPIAIIASLAIIFLAYFGTATIVTLMVPYYLQDINAPIPSAFESVGWDVGKWIVSIGGIFGLCASLFGAMFPLPRVIYAMASDGIIFKFLGRVHSRFQTPIIGTLLAGLLTGLMSALFDLKQLVNMMSIGTLLAYTIVAACVLKLRYSVDDDRQYALVRTSSDTESEGYEYDNYNSAVNTTNAELIQEDTNITFISIIKQVFNIKRLPNPTKITETVVIIQMYLFAILCLALWLCVMHLHKELKHGQTWAIALISVIGLFIVLILMSIATQPNSKREISFKVPLIPLIPALSILINIYLMLMLDFRTWIRFGVWMAVGLPMYFICIRCTGSSFSKNSNSKVHAKNNINGISKSNGYVNGSFLADHVALPDLNQEKEETVNTLNSKLPPIITNTTSSPVDNLSVTAVLAALDEVLIKEELSIVSSFTNNNPFSRKISVDTVSNNSIGHVEESVVALIHCEDNNNIYFEHEIPPTIIEEQTNFEVDSNSSSIKSKKSIGVEMQIIPTPPSMKDFETFKRLKLSYQLQDDMHTILKPKLRPVPYNRSKSVPDVIHLSNSDSKEFDDNVQFGSNQHLKVVLQLNKIFEKRTVTNKLIKPEVIPKDKEVVEVQTTNMTDLQQRSTELSRNNVQSVKDENDEIIEEVMTPSDIKQRLNEILKSDSRLTM